jgi:tetratricopeptide (TPR) repeat protein
VPLQQFYEEQTRSLRIFLNTQGPNLRVLLTDADTKEVVHRLLAGMNTDDRVKSVFVATDAPFTGPAEFFSRVYADLVEAFQPHAEELLNHYILPPPDWASLRFANPAERFVRGVSMFSNALPAEIGAVAFLIDPSSVSDSAGYRKALRYLAENTRAQSQWVKYVVLDDRVKGHTAELVSELPDVKAQSMYLSPAEMEQRIKWALDTGIGLGPSDRRVYTAMLAGFALSRKEYDDALRLTQEQLALTEPDGTPNDLAAVHYNMGNVHLGKKDFAAAVESFTEGLRLALQGHPGPLIPTIITNLGVALYRGGEPDRAGECFCTARVFSQKMNQRPTEAHVLDCMARCHSTAGRFAEAEGCWKEALAIYDGITAEQLRQARDGGRRLILLQLEEHYKSTRQADKLAAIREEMARGDS